MRKDKVQNVEKMMMEQGQSPKKNSGPIWVLGSRRKEHGELFSIQLVPGSQASTSRAQRGVKALSSVLADAAGKNNQVEACLRRRIAKYQVVCGTGRKNSKCVEKKQVRSLAMRNVVEKTWWCSGFAYSSILPKKASSSSSMRPRLREFDWR